MAADQDAPLRVCDLCGGVDRAPRHQIDYTGVADPPGEASAALIRQVARTPDLDDDVLDAVIADLQDELLQLRHMDCCAAAGCPDGLCVAHLRLSPGADVVRGQELHAKDGVTRNAKLAEFLTSGAVDHVGADLTAARAEQQGA